MKTLARDLLVELAGYVAGKIMARLLGKPKAPTAADLHEALPVGGATADAAERARAEADARWPAPAPVPRELVEEPIAGEPRREDLN